MRQALEWALTNVGIAIALVAAGCAAVLVAHPDEPGSNLQQLASGVAFAFFALMAYLPSVLVYLLALWLASRRFPGRTAAIVLVPLAPGLLWLVPIVEPEPLILSVFAICLVTYPALVRLPPSRRRRVGAG